jgi:murein L,D-transpeptidase YcbB/YkuD
VLLEEPIAVYLAYWTAAVDGQGDINFRRDPYGRDPAVLEGLETRYDFADSVQQRYDESR